MRQSPEGMAGCVERGQAVLCETRVCGGGRGGGPWAAGATPREASCAQSKVKASGKSWGCATAFKAS